MTTTLPTDAELEAMEARASAPRNDWNSLLHTVLREDIPTLISAVRSLKAERDSLDLECQAWVSDGVRMAWSGAKRLADLIEERDALSQQVAELTEALKPFAAMAAHYDKHYGNRPREPNHTVMQVATHDVGEHELTVGHFRSARAALSSINGGQS